MGHLMHELYQTTIKINGRTYCYDPGDDCYYRWHEQTPETERERWTKVLGGIILLVIIYVVMQYYQNVLL